ncbi:MAG: DUF86 domain-containing protein [Candidatus Peregrinibacteria bacterium]
MKDDRLYIWDMVQAGRSILRYLEGKTESDLVEDQMLFDAVVRQFQVLGEAANKLSESRKAALPGVPWSDVIGMRNMIVHEYSGIDVPTIWRTAREDLPLMLSVLGSLFREIDAELHPE